MGGLHRSKAWFKKTLAGAYIRNLAYYTQVSSVSYAISYVRSTVLLVTYVHTFILWTRFYSCNCKAKELVSPCSALGSKVEHACLKVLHYTFA